MSAGRPKVYSNDVVGKLALAAITNHINTFQGLHRYLTENPEYMASLGLHVLPSRRTLSRRLRLAMPMMGSRNGRPKKGDAHAL